MRRRFLHSRWSVEMTTTKTRIMADNFKKFLSFSRGERIAIITIVSLIVIILIIKYLLVLNPPKRDYFKHDFDSIIARREMVMDSMRIADSVEKANPSFRARRSDIAVISSEAKQNRDLSEAKAFAKGEKISNKKSYQSNQTEEIFPLPMVVGRNDIVVDLNTADTTLLKQLPGIGSAFAKWIVSYRDKLGGYCETEQLLEVYRMDTNRFNDIERFVKIDSVFVPNRLRINSDAFKVLLKHPYLEYEDVKKIVNYREQKGLITSWGQLQKILGDSLNPRLRYYIDYK